MMGLGATVGNWGNEDYFLVTMFPVFVCQWWDYCCVSWQSFFYPRFAKVFLGKPWVKFNSCACLGLKCILLTGRWSKIRRLNEAKMGSCPSVRTEVGSFSMDIIHRAAWHWWEVNRNITQMVKHTDEILSSRMSSSCQSVSSIPSFSSGQDESGWLIMTV